MEIRKHIKNDSTNKQKYLKYLSVWGHPENNFNRKPKNSINTDKERKFSEFPIMSRHKGGKSMAARLQKAGARLQGQIIAPLMTHSAPQKLSPLSL